MSLETLLAICRALDTTPNDILLGEYYSIPDDNAAFKETGSKLNPKDQILLQQITHLLEERNKD